MAFPELTELMIRVQQHRDRAAFGDLFDHFAPRLKSMAMRNGLSSGQAEDVVQEAMLKVWQKAGQFDPARAQVSAWIYQIARNQSVDMHRKEARPIPQDLYAPEDSEPDASDALAMEQENQALRSALRALPRNQRDMIERAYLGEMSHGDIQTQTGLPLGTIKSRIRLALERLRHDMKGTRS